MAMETRDYLLIGAAIGAWVLYTKRQALFDALNPTSDKNIAYQGTDAIVKAVAGEKATITDIVPGINTYEPNAVVVKTATHFDGKLIGYPSASAPYWYNKDGTKRTAPNGAMATAYDYNGRLIQIIDKATQGAVFV